MKSHTNLLNFSIQNQLKQIDENIILSKNNVFHMKKIKCPKCETLCVYNGTAHKGNYSIICKNNKLKFKTGQQYCPKCKKTIQVPNFLIKEIKEKLKQYIDTQIKSLTKLGVSQEGIKEHLQTIIEDFEISKSYIQKVQNKFLNKIGTYKTNSKQKNPQLYFFGYDEQYIKIKGRKFYRIVFLNEKLNKVIFESIIENITEEKLKKVLKQVFKKIFKNKIPKGFIFDTKPMYPKLFRNIFGKQIKLQYCLFHLAQLVLKEYNQTMKKQRISLWTIEEHRKLYEILNIFYNRESELKLIDGMIIKKQLAKFFDLKFDDKETIKEFRKIMKLNKIERKRKKEKLVLRTKQEAENKLEELIEISKNDRLYFPKKIKKRLNKIKKNFEFFTGGIEYGISTNNKLEGFFGSTLKKFMKKNFKVLKHLESFLKLKRLRKLNVRLYEPINIFEFSKLFSTISFFKT